MCLAALFVCAAVGAFVVLHSLNRPWLKRRLQAIARTSAGVDIDYEVVRIGLLSGAEIDGLVVQSPTELRRFAPALVRVGRLEARWSLGSLLGRSRPPIERMSVADVAWTVVVDEHGRTSFDALPSSGRAPEAGPKTPLSRQASMVFAKAPPVGQFDVGPVSLLLVRTEEGNVADRTELRGLAVTLVSSREPTGVGGWRADARLGSTGSPLALELTRATRGAEAAARAQLWVTIGANSSTLTAALDLRMMEQTLASSVSADHWLRAEVGVRFDPTAGRTEVALDHVDAGDGAATADASIEIPDAGDPIVHHARADVDAARLLRWLPAGLVPVTAERAGLHGQVDSLVAGAVPALTPKGSLNVDAELSNVAFRASAGPIEVAAGGLSLRAQPTAGGGIAGRGSVKVAGARLAWGADCLDADDLVLEFDGERGADEVIAGHVGLHVTRFELRGALPVVARDARAELRVGGLHPDLREPLSTRGTVDVSAGLSALDVRSPGMRTTIDGLTVHAHTALEGHAPYFLDVEAPIARLHVVRRDGVLVDSPARFEGKARGVELDLAHALGSRGLFSAAVTLGEMQASLEATKGADALDFRLSANTPSLKALRPLLPPDWTERAPWDRMAVAVRSSGHVEPLGGVAPAIRQATEIDVERPAFGSIAAQRLSLAVRSQGNLLEPPSRRGFACAGPHVRGRPSER